MDSFRKEDYETKKDIEEMLNSQISCYWWILILSSILLAIIFVSLCLIP